MRQLRSHSVSRLKNDQSLTSNTNASYLGISSTDLQRSKNVSPRNFQIDSYVKIENHHYDQLKDHSVSAIVKKQIKLPMKKRKKLNARRQKYDGPLHWKTMRILRNKIFYDVKKLNIMHKYLNSRTKCDINGHMEQKNNSQIKKDDNVQNKRNFIQMKDCCEKILTFCCQNPQIRFQKIQQISYIKQILQQIKQRYLKFTSIKSFQNNERQNRTRYNLQLKKQRIMNKFKQNYKLSDQYLMLWCNNQIMRLITTLTQINIHPYFTSLWNNIFGKESKFSQQQNIQHQYTNQNDNIVEIKVSNNHKIQQNMRLNSMKIDDINRIEMSQQVQIDKWYQQMRFTWKESLANQFIIETQKSEENQSST